MDHVLGWEESELWKPGIILAGDWRRMRIWQDGSVGQRMENEWCIRRMNKGIIFIITYLIFIKVNNLVGLKYRYTSESRAILMT